MPLQHPIPPPHPYPQFRRSTPGIVRDYLAEVLRQLDYVVEYSGPLLTLEDKVEFFTEARHAFGRSALILR